MNDDITPNELQALALNTEDPMIAGLCNKLEDKLNRGNYGGPQKFFGEAVVPILIELLLEVLTDAFGGCLGGSRARLARTIKEPNGIQKVLLKRSIRKELFNGSRKDYREGDGDTMLAAVLAVSREAEDSEVEAIASYVGDNHFVDHGSL